LGEEPQSYAAQGGFEGGGVMAVFAALSRRAGQENFRERIDIDER